MGSIDSNIRVFFSAVILAMFSSGALTAQSRSGAPREVSSASVRTPPLAFEAISIRPLEENTTSYGGGFFGATYHAHAYTTQMLIWEATGIDDPIRIKGMPQWAAGTQYDVLAKVDASDEDAFRRLSRPQRRAMVLSILSSRFQFAFHYEDGPIPVLNLDVTKKGLKHVEAYAQDGLTSTHPECKWPESHPDQGFERAEGCTMQDLARKLNRVDGFEVIDHSGLSGRYSFAIHFDPQATSSWVNGHTFPATPTDNAQWPSLYTALREQLGLQLTKATSVLPVLVIDRIAPPSGN